MSVLYKYNNSLCIRFIFACLLWFSFNQYSFAQYTPPNTPECRAYFNYTPNNSSGWANELERLWDRCLASGNNRSPQTQQYSSCPSGQFARNGYCYPNGTDFCGNGNYCRPGSRCYKVPNYAVDFFERNGSTLNGCLKPRNEDWYQSMLRSALEEALDDQTKEGFAALEKSEKRLEDYQGKLLSRTERDYKKINKQLTDDINKDLNRASAVNIKTSDISVINQNGLRPQLKPSKARETRIVKPTRSATPLTTQTQQRDLQNTSQSQPKPPRKLNIILPVPTIPAEDIKNMKSSDDYFAYLREKNYYVPADKSLPEANRVLSALSADAKVRNKRGNYSQVPLQGVRKIMVDDVPYMVSYNVSNNEWSAEKIPVTVVSFTRPEYSGSNNPYLTRPASKPSYSSEVRDWVRGNDNSNEQSRFGNFLDGVLNRPDKKPAKPPQRWINQTKAEEKEVSKCDWWVLMCDGRLYQNLQGSIVR